jgi:hypothetical protein
LTLEIVNQYSKKFPDRAVLVRDIPRYAELVKNGVGHYFHDPETAASDKVYFN